MNNVEAAKRMLEQAVRRLQTAKREAGEGSPAYAIRSAQECAELSLKAALRYVGIEYPKKHDVSPALLTARGRFPSWFEVERFAEVSHWLAERKEPAMYGDEVRGLSPDDVFTRKEAGGAVKHAETIYGACKKLISSRSSASGNPTS